MQRATLASAMLLVCGTLGAQSYDLFGPGCPGSLGIPFLDPGAGSVPRLGETFTLQLTNVPDNAGFIAFGFSTTDWFGLPLPFDATQINMPGCTIHVSVEFLAGFTAVGGVGEVSFEIPNLPGLIGARFHNQGFILDPGINPFLGGGVLSNAGTAVIGDVLLPPLFDLAGNWEVTEDWGENECFPDAPTDVYPVTIVQNGNDLSVAFPDRVGVWSESGSSVEWLGSFPAEGGMTTITESRLTAVDANTIQGTIDWCWTLDGSSFCYGTNGILATRQ